MPQAVMLKWMQYDRGWGPSFFGVSLHLTHTDALKFEGDYISRHHPKSYVPDVYEQSSSETLVEVTDELYEEIKKSVCGVPYNTIPTGIIK